MNAVACPDCGKSLPTDAPNGSCPNCLLGLAMNHPAGEMTSPHASRGEFTPPRADELVGKFPNLEIEHLLGHGGMGAVYRARQTNLDRTVALKILSPRLTADASFSERFLREAKALAKLAHPNIVMVFDFGQSDDMLYLVMEYVDGVNLREAIEGERLPPARALEIIPQICDALQYAHDQGVVHRDIKPENILIDRQGKIKIADFGLAKLRVPGSDFTLTGTRQILGTASYMAPEQVESPNRVDHRADIYSLGVVFYELLTGELPLGRFSLPSEKAAVSNRLDEIVMRTLEKNPDRRYQQASEMKTAVETADVEPVVAQAAVPRKFAGRVAASNSPRTVALPFKLSQVHGGFCEAFGIARGYDDQLELEFEVRDAFGVSKSRPKRAEVPFEHIVSIRYRPGVFNDRIEVQADRIDAVQDVPSSAQGKFQLHVKKADRAIAQRFTEECRSLLPHANVLPVAPIKSESRTPDVHHDAEEERVLTQERLAVPRLGMFLGIALNLLFGLSVLFVFLPFGALRDGVVRNFAADERMLIQAAIAAAACVSLMVVGVLAITAKNMGSLRKYHVSVAGLIVALIPLNPLAVLVIPFAIWGLVVMGMGTTKRVFRREAIRAARESQDEFKSDVFDDELSRDMVWRTARTALGFLGLFLIVGAVSAVLMYFIWSARVVMPEEATRPMETISVTEGADSIRIETDGQSTRITTE